MPIQFPLAVRGHPTIQARGLTFVPAGFVPAPNLGNPGARFTIDTLNGRGKLFPRSNPISQGVNFAKMFATPVDQRPQALIDAALWREILGTLNMVMIGISRDSAGATLGSCRVMLFRTQDMMFVQETTSDASGNWTMSVMKGGPFFLVEYKVGSPDLSGTSLNTLAPVQA